MRLRAASWTPRWRPRDVLNSEIDAMFRSPASFARAVWVVKDAGRAGLEYRRHDHVKSFK